MTAKLLIFNSFQEMPERVLRACQKMGYVNDGILRDVVNDYLSFKRMGTYPKYHYLLKTAFVLEVDGKIVGWSCVYKNGNTVEAGIWTKRTERKKGYGKILMDAVLNKFSPDDIVLYGKFDKYAESMR